MRHAWLNGRIIPGSEAVVSIYDSAMMYGDSVFEMTRTFNRTRFLNEEHLDRLERSMARLHLRSIPYRRVDILNAQDALDRANAESWASDDEVRELITVGRGPLPLYRHLKPEPWLMICQYPLRWVLQDAAHRYRAGIAGYTTDWRSLPQDCVPSHVKHHNRINFRLAEQAVPEGGWAVMQDQEGFLTEATGANLFLATYSELWTPPIATSLPGISQAFVRTLADTLGIPTRELLFRQPHHAPVQEAFFTCTPWSIVPWTSLNGKPIGDGRPGAITKRLTQAWIDSVGCAFVQQAERWEGEEMP